MRPVLMPTSVPKPYLNPSANLEEALTNVPAESTPRVNWEAERGDSVMMTSVWWEEWELMWEIAAGREGTVRIERVRERCSVS